MEAFGEAVQPQQFGDGEEAHLLIRPYQPEAPAAREATAIQRIGGQQGAEAMRIEAGSGVASGSSDR